LTHGFRRAFFLLVGALDNELLDQSLVALIPASGKGSDSLEDLLSSQLYPLMGL